MSGTKRSCSHALWIAALGVLAAPLCGARAAERPETAPTSRPADAESARAMHQRALRAATEGQALYAKGRYEQALARCEAALAIFRRLYPGRANPWTARALDSVATCRLALGRYGDALLKYRAARAMRRRIWPDGRHPDVAASFYNEAACLESLGRSREAVVRMLKAAAIQVQLYGIRGHPDLAKSLDGIASCEQSLGQHEVAVAMHRRALAMRRGLYRDPDHPKVADSLNNLAACLHEMGRYAEALPKFRTVLTTRQRIHKQEDHPNVARALNNVAACLGSLGRRPEALPIYEAALAMRKRIHGGRDHPGVGTSLNNLAACLAGLGRHEEALPKYEAALAMMTRVFRNRDHPTVASSLDNVAACLAHLGRSAEALPKYEAALAMRKRIHGGPDHAEVAISLHNVGSCLKALGRSADALTKCRAALAMGERLHSPHAFRFAAMLGRIHLEDLSKPAEAVKAFEKAIGGMEQARVLVGGSDLDRARFFSLIRRSGAFEGMIRAQLRLGRADKALEYAERGRALGLRDVLERGRRLHGGDLLGTVEAAARMRGDDAVMREVAEARKREREAFAAVATLTAQRNALRGRKDLSEAQRGAGIRTLTAALAKAWGAHESARRAVFNLAGTHAVHDLKPLSAAQIQGLLAGRGRLLAYTVTRTGAVLLAAPPAGGKIRGFSLKWPDGKPVTAPTLRKAVGRYVAGMTAEGELARGVKRGGGGRHSPAEHAALGYRLFQALIPAELRGELASAGQVYVIPDGALHRLPFETLITERPSPAAPSAKGRAYWLDGWPPLIYGPSATVLVNRKKARDRQLARLARGGSRRRQAVLLGDPVFDRRREPRKPVPKRGVVVMAVKGGSAAERIGMRRGAVITRYGPHDVAGIAELDKAFETLFGRLRRRELKALPKLVFWQRGAVAEQELSPKEELGAALAEMTERTRKWVESGEALDAASQAATVERSGYLSRYGTLTPLPGTRQEVRQIYRTLTGREYRKGSADRRASVLLGEEATRTRLYADAAGSRYLHLATHGLVNTSAWGLYSSLALTQPRVPTGRDFGFLTLVDLLDHWWGRLGATELVVLSACNTQRGRMEPGEGVFGMPWGFMYAGAPAVIASLWQVADRSTAEMMGHLYAEISREEGRGGRSAKLAAFTKVRKALRGKYPQPYFWAPFVYIGDPR